MSIETFSSSINAISVKLKTYTIPTVSFWGIRYLKTKDGSQKIKLDTIAKQVNDASLLCVRLAASIPIIPTQGRLTGLQCVETLIKHYEDTEEKLLHTRKITRIFARFQEIFAKKQRCAMVSEEFSCSAINRFRIFTTLSFNKLLTQLFPTNFLKTFLAISHSIKRIRPEYFVVEPLEKSLNDQLMKLLFENSTDSKMELKTFCILVGSKEPQFLRFPETISYQTLNIQNVE